MAPAHSTSKAEREKKLKELISFASGLTKRFANLDDATLTTDLQTHIRALPLAPSSILTAKQDELDRLGVELWNLSTRLRRDSIDNAEKNNDLPREKHRSLCLLRVFSFLLLDSAAAHTKGAQVKTCIRLMKIALKAARTCIDNKELSHATKILGSAADYEEALNKEANCGREDDQGLVQRLRLEYFAMRTTLAWRQDRMDTAEHMFAKCKELSDSSSTDPTEMFSDLLFEIGKTALMKHEYQAAATWLERAFDSCGKQEIHLQSAEASELRLSIMHSIVQTYVHLKSSGAQDRAWQMLKLMETEYADKMVVMLLKIELLAAAPSLDSSQFYNVLLHMIRTVVLNETNFRTIIHHLHKLKNHSNDFACKALDELIDCRLFREENQAWIEKATITRVWMGTTNTQLTNVLEDLERLFDLILQNLKTPFTAPATHAAQTLLWKQVEALNTTEQASSAEKWCRLCAHSLFEQAGAQNKSKIARKLIQCALLRQDFDSARKTYNSMADTGKEDPVTQYLMFKVGIQSGNIDLASETLDSVARASTKDATLLYACVLDAQSNGDRKQAIQALERVLDKYNYSAPTGIHLPALLRSTARLLQQELIQDGKVRKDTMVQLCKLFEGAYTQAQVSRKRASAMDQQTFTTQEFEWFCKNTYNMALKYCAELDPKQLVVLLTVCINFMELLRDDAPPNPEGDLCLRLIFCQFLATCTYATMARAEDNLTNHVTLSQYYRDVRKHSREFRKAVAEGIEKLGGAAQSDIISKHLQIVKLELEAVLKLGEWDELDNLFELCWKYKSPDHYETLADLVLVINACIKQEKLDERYQKKLLCVLEKIINLTARQAGNDITKLSRWLRCLFDLALTFDEEISLRCIKQAVDLAQRRQGDPDQYPQTELEWLATTTFNHAIDYYAQDNDSKCKEWASQAFVIAQWIADDGGLRNTLMEKFASLQLNV